jgi:hypothetical protein
MPDHVFSLLYIIGTTATDGIFYEAHCRIAFIQGPAFFYKPKKYILLTSSLPRRM